LRLYRSNTINHHRTSSSTWYDQSPPPNIANVAAASTSTPTQPQTPRSIYGTVPSAAVVVSSVGASDSSSYDSCSENRRNSEVSIESMAVTSKIVASTVNINSKKKKSRCGSESPCGGSNSSRSHSRSPSSCSSTNSSGSSSNGSSSSPGGGPEMSRSTRSLQSAVSAPSSNSAPIGTFANPAVHSEDNRPLAICVRNLPARSSDTSLKDGLYHEYKKHGKVTWVKVVGQNADRYALVCFKKPDDVEKALEVSHDKLFFGCKIEVAPYQGYDVEDNEFRPYEAELDEYHPKSTRTLFIGNLEKDITASELRKHFECFGEIIEIDIKKQGVTAYAFCQYSDIISVVKAMRKMDGEHLGNNRIKLGFGKSMPTNCVWIDGISDSVGEAYLTTQFNRFGSVSQVAIDRERKLALVFFEQIQYAQTAVKEMRGVTLRGRKLQVDFASRECQEAFFDKLDKLSVSDRTTVGFETAREVSTRGFETTVVVPGARFNRYETPGRSRASSFSRHSGLGSSGGAGSPTNTERISGSTTPRGGRARPARYTEAYYESNDYVDNRRYRNYDEYSQGSAASHEEVYDQEATFNAVPTVGVTGTPTTVVNPNYVRERPESPTPRINVIDPDILRRRCEKSPGNYFLNIFSR